MALPDLSFNIGHRERLRQKFLDDKLPSYEALELLLAYIIPRRDVRPIARGLLQKYGGIHQIITAPLEELMAFSGIGKNTAIFIKLIRHIMLLDFQDELAQRPAFYDEQVLFNYARTLLAGKSIEECHILYLDAKYRLIESCLHSSGTINWSAIYPHEIVKKALSLGARNIIMMHNHPTADMAFSQEDIDMTMIIMEKLKFFEIELFDHILVAGNRINSARNGFFLLKLKK